MATTYDKASLVMIPSGYKDDKLYAVKPTDGSGDFTFSRDGSGASPATRVNASGLIEKGRENVLLQSNQFDTTWVNSNTTETGGQSGYDGTNDAWLLSKSGSNGFLHQNITNSEVQTFSIYAKAGSLDFIRFRISSGSTQSAYFDLSNGLVGSTSADIESKIEDIGSGWYRCSTALNDSVTQIRIYPADADNDTSGTSGNIYIQDAQLESGLVSTSYIETTTAPVSAGLLGDMPRLDYSGGATCPSLLLEPSRVNIIDQSEYIDALAKTGVTITANETTSPEGVVNASKVAYASGAAYLVGGSSLTTGTDYTFSGFFKADESNYVIVNQAGAGAKNAFYNLADGTHSGASGITTDMIDYGNGWYRIIYTDNLLYNSIRIYMSGNGSYGNYPSVGEGFFAWGFQTEQASYPTSYIPTYGSASTRAKDFFVMNLITNGITTPIQTEATLFVEFEKPNTGENVDLMRWKGTGALGRGYLYNTAAGWASDWGSSQQLNIGIGNNKVAWRLDSLTSGTDFVNGTKGTGSSGTAWSDIRELRFNAEGGGGVLRVKQILLFPTALTDAECISLTTL